MRGGGRREILTIKAKEVLESSIVLQKNWRGQGPPGPPSSEDLIFIICDMAHCPTTAQCVTASDNSQGSVTERGNQKDEHRGKERGVNDNFFSVLLFMILL